MEGFAEVPQGLGDLSDLRAHCRRGSGGILSPSVYHGQSGCLCAIEATDCCFWAEGECAQVHGIER